MYGFSLERCIDCRFVFANPRFPEKELLGGYDNRSAHAGEVHSKSDLAALYASRMTQEAWDSFDRILTRLESSVGKAQRLLDFGCGAAYFVQRAQQRGWDAHGVEVGSWAVESAAMRNVEHVHVGTLAQQGFSPESFDVVTAHQVLEHLSNPRADLVEIRRVLRPGGLFYANVPNYRCLSILLGRDDFESNHPMGHLSYFTPTTLRELLRRSGFEPLWTNTYGGLKWENIVGQPTQRPHEQSSPLPEPPPVGTARPSRDPGWKRVLRPWVERLLYRGAEVGMELEICARRPSNG